jgi:hypothetical protein
MPSAPPSTSLRDRTRNPDPMRSSALSPPWPSNTAVVVRIELAGMAGGPHEAVVVLDILIQELGLRQRPTPASADKKKCSCGNDESMIGFNAYNTSLLGFTKAMFCFVASPGSNSLRRGLDRRRDHALHSVQEDSIHWMTVKCQANAETQCDQ